MTQIKRAQEHETDTTTNSAGQLDLCWTALCRTLRRLLAPCLEHLHVAGEPGKKDVSHTVRLLGDEPKRGIVGLGLRKWPWECMFVNKIQRVSHIIAYHFYQLRLGVFTFGGAIWSRTKRRICPNNNSFRMHWQNQKRPMTEKRWPNDTDSLWRCVDWSWRKGSQ